MSSDLSRRSFIHRAAAAGAVAVASRVALAQEGEANKAEQPKTEQPADQAKPIDVESAAEKLNVAFVGVLGQGGANLTRIHEAGVNVVALCDIDANRLAKAAASHTGAKTYADFRKMLEEQKDIDAVVVSTPDHTHAVAAMMAMSLGKHVYCEKPLTHNIYEARALTLAARQHKVATQMGNQGHASEGSRRQVELVKSGLLGPIKEVHVWTDRPVWPQGIQRPGDTPDVPKHVSWDLWLGPAPERPYHPAYHPFKWRGFWDFGTGALGDMACHIMDTAYWSLDLRDPTSVEAFSDGGNEESAPSWSIIRYEFPQRGERPPLKLFWYEGGVRPSQRLVGKWQFPDNGVIFIGEKATIAAPYLQDPVFINEEQAKDIKIPERSIEPSIGHHKEWVQACKGGKPAGSNFDYAGPLTEMVLLGNLALRTGRRVEYDAANMKVTNLPEANQYIRREYRKGWSL
jgi:predicted dehydrogenase